MVLENIVNKTANFVKENKSLCIWTAAYIMAGIADNVMTTSLARNLSEEGNQILRNIWDNFGVVGMYAFKFSTLPLLVYISKESKNNIALAIPTVGYTIMAISWSFSDYFR
jgi:hypothetical protein